MEKDSSSGTGEGIGGAMALGGMSMVRGHSPTPVDQRQKPIGSSLVTISPLSSFCEKRILSGRTPSTLAFVKTST